jgi:hypothetical protein
MKKLILSLTMLLGSLNAMDMKDKVSDWAKNTFAPFDTRESKATEFILHNAKNSWVLKNIVSQYLQRNWQEQVAKLNANDSIKTGVATHTDEVVEFVIKRTDKNNVAINSHFPRLDYQTYEPFTRLHQGNTLRKENDVVTFDSKTQCWNRWHRGEYQGFSCKTEISFEEFARRFNVKGE